MAPKRKGTKAAPGFDPLKPRPDLYGLPFTADDFRGMPFRRFGTSGLRVSEIGLGTWKFGYPRTGDFSRVGEKAALGIMDAAIEEGVTFWDTANRYNNASGNSERIIGKWFAANPGQRRTVELATKIYGLMDGAAPNFCRLSRVNIMEAVYASLERLRTDRIEVLQFHQVDETVPAEESLMAAEDLIALDVVRYLGISNVSLDQMDRFERLSRDFPRARIRSVQNQFDILHGEDPGRKGVFDECARRGLSFIPWSPLRGGLLSDRYVDGSLAGPGDRLVDEKRLEKELTGPIVRKIGALAALAREWSLSLTQLTLAYMRRLPAIGPLIVGCSTREQLRENAKAGKVAFSPDQIKAMEAVLRG
jgi:aryl-alcohol dehydrogenase-like predicted oxidoreductase